MASDLGSSGWSASVVFRGVQMVEIGRVASKSRKSILFKSQGCFQWQGALYAPLSPYLCIE